MKKKYPRLTKRERQLASRYIAEERREKKPGRKKTRKYGAKQAIAIGISRARRKAKLEEIRRRHQL